MEQWFSLYKGGVGEIEEKKSRFIATIAPVTTVEEASDFIAKTKKQYWDARHNCSAYVIGDDGQNTRCSDDGEPSGTAGRPMLEVLTREHITNVCVVVTRYFGGTLLGTGGLVRAYQGAVKEGLANCSVLKKLKGVTPTVICDYNSFNRIQLLCNQEDYFITNIDYADAVTISCIFEEDRFEAFNTMIMDTTNGKGVVDPGDKVIYAMVDGRPQVFD